MEIEFDFADDPGQLLDEYRRTPTAFFLFCLLVLLPFTILSVLTGFAFADWLATEGWDMNPLGYLILLLSGLCFLFWLILRRVIAFRTLQLYENGLQLYENGLRMSSFLRDLWLPWELIDRISHEHTIFYVKLLPLKYNLLKIYLDGCRFDIESGTGFAFEQWQTLFSEILRLAVNAKFTEDQDWMAL